MARRRAILAGLGTTGVLVGLALVLLAVVGALLAFHGWPGTAGGGSLQGVSLDDKRLVRAAPPSFAAAAVPGTRSIVALPRRRGGRRSRAGRAAARQGVAGIRRTLRAGRAGEDPAAAGPGVTSAPSGPAPSSAAQGVSDAVRGVTGGGGQDLGNTAAPVGQLVKDTGDAVSQTVRELGSKAEAKLPDLP
jgi:hypothetical protein